MGYELLGQIPGVKKLDYIIYHVINFLSTNNKFIEKISISLIYYANVDCGFSKLNLVTLSRRSVKCECSKTIIQLILKLC